MDLSQYSDDQLAQLRNQIDGELAQRAEVKKDALVREIHEKPCKQV